LREAFAQEIEISEENLQGKPIDLKFTSFQVEGGGWRAEGGGLKAEGGGWRVEGLV
jgi:hypothetical protein